MTENLRRVPVLEQLMAFLHALLSNPNLLPEPYVGVLRFHISQPAGYQLFFLFSDQYFPLQLHQVLPPALTCVVGKVLGEKPTDDHWALRRAAAALVGHICSRFGQNNNVQVCLVRPRPGL